MNTQHSPNTLATLTIQLLDDGQASAEDLDEMTRLLLDEIKERSLTNGVRLKPATNQPVAGTKSNTDLLTVGTLLLAVLPDALSALICFFQEWTLRPGNGPVKIKAQMNDCTLEVEYDPRVTSNEEMIVFAREIQAMVAKKPDRLDG